MGLERSLKNVITRDLNVDLVKGLSFVQGKKQGNTVEINIKALIRISFKQIERVSEVQFRNIDRKSMFKSCC